MKRPGVIILAAGKGKRMSEQSGSGPESYDHEPKVLRKLNDKPLIDYVIRAAVGLDPSIIVVVTGYKKDLVIDYVTGLMRHIRAQIREKDSRKKDTVKLEFALQERQLGTGHAVQQTEEKFAGFDGDIVLLNGDVPLITTDTMRGLICHHNNTTAAVTILTAVYENPHGYGRIIRDTAGELTKIVEERDATPAEKSIKEINTGTMVFGARQFFPYLSKLSRDNAQNELYITDMVGILRDQGRVTSAWIAQNKEETYGVNTIEDLSTLQSILTRT